MFANHKKGNGSKGLGKDKGASACHHASKRGVKKTTNGLNCGEKATQRGGRVSSQD